MHSANYPRCPAKDVNCRQCGKSGHFAEVCRSKDHKYQVREVTVPDVTVLSINTQASEQIRGNLFCDVRLCTPDGQACSTKLLVDSGHWFSRFHTFRVYLPGHFKNALLTEPKLHLVTYLKKTDHCSWLSSSTGATQPCFCAC